MDVRISVEETNEVDRSIKIEIPRGLYSGEFDRRLQQTASRVQLKGFRPGRAPRAMVAKLYGDRIHAEVMEGLVSNAIDTAIKDHSMKVVGRPVVTVEDDEVDRDLAVRAEVSVYPEPEIKGYEGISVEVELEEATEEMKAERLEQLRSQAATFAEKESMNEIGAGDVVVLDFHGTKDGEPVKGLHRHNVVSELGSERGDPLARLVEPHLEGMSKGDEKKVTMTIPDDFSDDEIRGNECEVTFKLTGVYHKQIPDLDDAFAKSTGFGETLDELKQRIAESIEKELEERNRRARESALYGAIVARNGFRVPQHMVDEEIRTMLAELRLIDPNDPRSAEFDVARFRQTLGERAEQRVKQVVAMDRIIEQEKLEPSDDQVEEWLNELAAENGQERQDLNRAIGYPQRKWWFRRLLARKQLTDKLLASASLTEKKRG